MFLSKKKASADYKNLRRVFTVPEGRSSTLSQIEKEISKNIQGFLSQHIVSGDAGPEELECNFQSTSIPEEPIFVSEQADFLLSKVVSQSVHTSSPSFIGHMTSALPYFMLPLGKIMMALNQNLVKIETSKAFTPLERQVIAMLHNLVYGFGEDFYKKTAQDRYHSLGVFCSGGTVANVTSLWVARNKLLGPDGDFLGVNEEGLYRALRHYNLEGLAILVSKRGHYSLSKACDALGIGKRYLVAVDTDQDGRLDVEQLEVEIHALREAKIGVVGVVGIAGTTETGQVDPLEEIGEVCRRLGCYYHIDASWGGPTLFSERYGQILNGIDQADSVSIDAHKQLYVPMGAGMALFRDHQDLGFIEQNAQYVIRSGSRDLGKRSLEGSRPGMAMMVHSALHVLGRKGYELLIDHGIDLAKKMAGMILESDDFELTTEPNLNILTYRYVPEEFRDALANSGEQQQRNLNRRLNQLTIAIQKKQRSDGKTFVSRTRLDLPQYADQSIDVFRVVLANPLTDESIIKMVLDEQRQIASELGD